MGAQLLLHPCWHIFDDENWIIPIIPLYLYITYSGQDKRTSRLQDMPWYVLVESDSETDEHDNSKGQHGNQVIQCSFSIFPKSTPQWTLHRVFIGAVTPSMYNYPSAPLQRSYSWNIPRRKRKLPVTVWVRHSSSAGPALTQVASAHTTKLQDTPLSTPRDLRRCVFAPLRLLVRGTAKTEYLRGLSRRRLQSSSCPIFAFWSEDERRCFSLPLQLASACPWLHAFAYLQGGVLTEGGGPNNM